MLPIEPLIKFGFLYLAEKTRDTKRWPVYKSALVYLIPVTIFHYFMPFIARVIVDMSSVNTNNVAMLWLPWQDLLMWVKQYVGSVAILALLARFEDTTAAWLITFAGGFMVLAFVL